MLDRLFKLSKNNTNVKTEVMAGITTFMTMAYILAVNPSIFADAGMDASAVLLATAIASFFATCCMAFYGKPPLCTVCRNGSECVSGLYRGAWLRLQLAAGAAVRFEVYFPLRCKKTRSRSSGFFVSVRRYAGPPADVHPCGDMA